MNFLNPEFQIIRDKDRCIKCGACVRQCSYEVHVSDKDTGELYTNDINCVACHRCTSICPTRSLTVKKIESAYRESANWTSDYINQIFRQAETGGVCCPECQTRSPTRFTGIRYYSTQARSRTLPSTRSGSRWKQERISAPSRIK